MHPVRCGNNKQDEDTSPFEAALMPSDGRWLASTQHTCWLWGGETRDMQVGRSGGTTTTGPRPSKPREER